MLNGHTGAPLDTPITISRPTRAVKDFLELNAIRQDWAGGLRQMVCCSGVRFWGLMGPAREASRDTC
jgi:hypothetical protein